MEGIEPQGFHEPGSTGTWAFFGTRTLFIMFDNKLFLERNNVFWWPQ
jgi:hypothetical protein